MRSANHNEKKRQAQKEIESLRKTLDIYLFKIESLEKQVREIRVDPPGARIELHLNTQLTIGERQSQDRRVYPDIASMIGHQVLDCLRKTDKNHHQLQYEWREYLKNRYATADPYEIHQMMQKPFGFNHQQPVPEGKRLPKK